MTRSDCVNVFIYETNVTIKTKYRNRVYHVIFFLTSYAIPLSAISSLYLLLLQRIQRRKISTGRDGARLSVKAKQARQRVMKYNEVPVMAANVK